MIYHVAKIEEWKASADRNDYYPFDYEREGFIHCSFSYQLEGVLERYYQDEKAVLILTIDENTLISKVEAELSELKNEIYPHIYGSINKDAIVHVEHELLSRGGGGLDHFFGTPG